MSLSVFINVIDMLGSEEQVAKWSKPTTELNILGCYAQTELGHGSNVAGLETTATFDQKTDSFIINSPTLTSTKYWPGGMGKWANYATVFANLVLDGNPIGV
jgi:acyl-CoA oxidase